MNRHAIGAFLATIGVAVPAGWHLIDADLHTDGKHVRHLQQTMIVGDATVTLDVDKPVIATGDAVIATLVATAPTERDIKVELTTYTVDDAPGSRVGPPPRAVDHENLTLHAAPGGGTPTKTKVVLGSNKMAPGRLDTFTLFLSPRGAERKVGEDGQTPTTENGVAAAASVITWSGDTMGLRIEPRPPKEPGDPFVVAVHVKNPDPDDTRINVSLGTQVNGYGVESSPDETAPGITALGDSYDTLPAHTEHVYEFQVDPNGPARDVAFIAHAYVLNAGMGVSARGGAMDIAMIHLPAGEPDDKPAPTVAGK